MHRISACELMDRGWTWAIVSGGKDATPRVEWRSLRGERIEINALALTLEVPNDAYAGWCSLHPII